MSRFRGSLPPKKAMLVHLLDVGECRYISGCKTTHITPGGDIHGQVSWIRSLFFEGFIATREKGAFNPKARNIYANLPHGGERISLTEKGKAEALKLRFRLSPARMRVLRAIAEGKRASLIRSGADATGWLGEERVRFTFLLDLAEEKLIKDVEEPSLRWRNSTYEITELGLEVLRAQGFKPKRRRKKES